MRDRTRDERRPPCPPPLPGCAPRRPPTACADRHPRTGAHSVQETQQSTSSILIATDETRSTNRTTRPGTSPRTARNRARTGSSPNTPPSTPNSASSRPARRPTSTCSRARCRAGPRRCWPPSATAPPSTGCSTATPATPKAAGCGRAANGARWPTAPSSAASSPPGSGPAPSSPRCARCGSSARRCRTRSSCYGTELMLEFIGDAGRRGRAAAGADPAAPASCADLFEQCVAAMRAAGPRRLRARRPVAVQPARARRPAGDDRPAADRRPRRQPAGPGVPASRLRERLHLVRPARAATPSSSSTCSAIWSPRRWAAGDAARIVAAVAHFDLAIIGSGSGNSLVTPDFDDWHIAIIEESTFGGTCLNVGCIPTKMYVYPADIAAQTRDGARLGVDAHVDGVRWPDIRDRIFGRIDAISAGGRDYRARTARQHHAVRDARRVRRRAHAVARHRRDDHRRPHRDRGRARARSCRTW